MRHCADELARSVARQLGVSVERNDVFDCPQRRDIADDERESVALVAEERVQSSELPALALEPHPDSFLRIPCSRTMEQEEGTLCGVAIAAFDRTIRGLR